MSNQLSDHCSRRCVSCGLFLSMLLMVSTVCQAQDAVFKNKSGRGKSKVSGKITRITPEDVTIDGEVVPASEIRKLDFSKEPKELGRARDQMEAGRFADCLTELGKINSSVSSKTIQAEIDFLRAYSNSKISLLGGDVTAQMAGKEIGAFISNHPTSHHLYPAMEQLGRQLYAYGKLELAADEFKKLGNAQWNEYKLIGLLEHAKILADLERYGEAKESLDALLKLQSKDDMTQAHQLFAQCEQARIAGLEGDVDGSRQAIDGLIRDENPDNKQLFGRLYNAKGAVYEKSGQLKQAAIAYLHTELLFPSEAELHAEALYHLALIWPKLDQTDRASRARDTLKSRYRNSYWAGKL